MSVRFNITGLYNFYNTNFAKQNIKKEFVNHKNLYTFFGPHGSIEMFVREAAPHKYIDESLTIREWLDKYCIESTTVKDFQNAIAEAHCLTGHSSPITAFLQRHELYENHTKVGHYIDLADRKISFVPYERLGRVYPNSEELVNKYRVETTIGRFIRKLMPTFTDKEVETYTNLIKAKFFADDVSLELIQGEDIRYWYHEGKYDFSYDIGDLANSCMRYDSCQDSLELYVKNPEVCSMLIAKRKDKLVGRSLIWTTDTKTYYDRIYAGSAVRALMTEYCNKQGWSKIYCSDILAKVNLNDTPIYNYPYMDSFSYLKENVLSTYNQGRSVVLHDVPPENNDEIIEDDDPESITITVRHGNDVYTNYTDSDNFADPMFALLSSDVQVEITSEWGSYHNDSNGWVNMELLNEWKTALQSGNYESHISEYYMKVSKEFGKETRTYNAFGVLIDLLVQKDELQWETQEFKLQNDVNVRRSFGLANGRFRVSQNDIWNHVVSPSPYIRNPTFLQMTGLTYETFCTFDHKQAVETIDRYIRYCAEELARLTNG